MSLPDLLYTRRALLAALASAGSAGHCLAAMRAAVDAHDALALECPRVAPPGMDPRGHLVSEKLDGVRAVWDGRQLRFRSGRVVPAPHWFTDALPHVALDGELWAGRGRFDLVSGTVRRAVPDDAAWHALRLMVFDLPGAAGDFAARAARIAALAGDAGSAVWAAVEQTRVSDPAALQRWLDRVVHGGGEGLVLHRADAPWAPGRSSALWKLKPLNDAEAQVLVHEPGRGRLAGLMGALRVRTADGIEFRIGTGFTDAQRRDPPAVGSWISYTHRGLTPAGVPRFASYWRAHDAGL